MFKEFQWLCYDYRYQENVITLKCDFMWLLILQMKDWLSCDKIWLIFIQELKKMTFLWLNIDFWLSLTKCWLLTLHIKCGKKAITSGSLITHDNSMTRTWLNYFIMQTFWLDLTFFWKFIYLYDFFWLWNWSDFSNLEIFDYFWILLIEIMT